MANAPELTAQTRFSVGSPSFADGGVIPVRHCGMFTGANISPGLTWDSLPAGTQNLVLMIEDIDVPRSAPGIHTIAAFAPTGDQVAENQLAEGALVADNPDIRFLTTDFGRAKYVGPAPIPGHGTHRYRFHLYALDAPVDLTQIDGPQQLPAALSGHVLAAGTLTGIRRT